MGKCIYTTLVGGEVWWKENKKKIVIKYVKAWSTVHVLRCIFVSIEMYMHVLPR